MDAEQACLLRICTLPSFLSSTNLSDLNIPIILREYSAGYSKKDLYRVHIVALLARYMLDNGIDMGTLVEQYTEQIIKRSKLPERFDYLCEQLVIEVNRRGNLLDSNNTILRTIASLLRSSDNYNKVLTYTVLKLRNVI